MRIQIKVYPEANNNEDCVPEAMSYQASSYSFVHAKEDLETLRKITEKDAKATEETETL